MRSFIVRIYRRRGSRELSGTLEPVEPPHAATRPPPQAFANAAELLHLMQAEPAAPPCPTRGAAGGGPDAPLQRDRKRGRGA